MPKKISEKEKEEIIAGFLIGEPIDYLSKKFNLSKITISRHIKKNISERKYKGLINNNKKNELELKTEKKLEINNFNNQENIDEQTNLVRVNSENTFMEIAPLNCEIDNLPQKDFSSVPISDVELPDTVYMIVDKAIELETKYLKEYPEWQFLSQEELNRKTIEIYFDIKVAKRFCNKEQKVIKVPNTSVFKIASASLLEKGISRIVTSDKLISL